MQGRHPERVEDYTTANLILIAVNLMWVFGLIWSVWGIFPVIVAGLLLNHCVTRIEAVKAARDRAAIRVGQERPRDTV